VRRRNGLTTKDTKATKGKRKQRKKRRPQITQIQGLHRGEERGEYEKSREE
jgi:hypothetical protein